MLFKIFHKLFRKVQQAQNFFLTSIWFLIFRYWRLACLTDIKLTVRTFCKICFRTKFKYPFCWNFIQVRATFCWFPFHTRTANSIHTSVCQHFLEFSFISTFDIIGPQVFSSFRCIQVPVFLPFSLSRCLSSLSCTFLFSVFRCLSFLLRRISKSFPI